MSQGDLKAGQVVNLKKVSELTEQTTVSATDTLPISDVTGGLKKITVENILSPISGGVGNATNSTVPIPGINTYNVKGLSGNYSNFLVAAATPANFTTEELEGKLWQLVLLQGATYWTKKEVPIDLSGYMTKSRSNIIGTGFDSSYNAVHPTNVSTRILYQPLGVDGNITKLTIRSGRAGTLQCGIFSRSGDVFTLVGDSFNITLATVGTLNTITTGLPTGVLAEYYFGWYVQNPTSAAIGYKTVTGVDSWVFTGSGMASGVTFTHVTTIDFGIQVEVTTATSDEDVINAHLAEIDEKIAPVTAEVEVGTDHITGLVTGGIQPGTANANIYVLNQEINGAINQVTFRASVAGTMEVILLTKDGSNYNVDVRPQTVVLGNNVIVFNESFVGKVAIRMYTAKFFYVTTGGTGLTSVSLTALGITTSDPTPATIAASLVDANNLPTWDISLVVSYKEFTTENDVIYRLEQLELAPGSELNGIKYTQLGDSIASLAQGNTFASRIATRINSLQYVNYAIPGATWTYRPGTVATDNPVSTDDTNVIPNQVRKLIKAYEDELIEAPDLINIAAGINDVSRGLALGDIATQFALPLDSVNFQTLTGAMRWSIAKLMQTFPDVRIVIQTPLLTSVPERNYTASLPYVNQMKAVAARLSVPIIDCFGESLINEVNEDRYMQPDKLHPKDLGQEMQYLYVFKKLSGIYYGL